MKIVIIVLAASVLTGVFIWGCTMPNRDVDEHDAHVTEDASEIPFECDEREEMSFHEENYRILSNIFDTVADDLESFVEFLREHDMLYNVDFRIVFIPNEVFPSPRSWRIENRGERGAIAYLFDSQEFSDIVEKICGNNIFGSISISKQLPDTTVEIEFSIITEETQLEQGNYGVNALFRYIEGDIDMEEIGWGRRMRDGWYKDILPPPG
jgi:hypothetical protein